MLATLSFRKKGLEHSWLILLILLFSLLYLTTAFAQNQANTWYFGEGAGLNFNTNPPSQMEDGNAGLKTFTGEGVGSISDANGNLLFYTNGARIFTRTHIDMLTSAGGALPALNGNGTTTQTGLIIPINGSPNKYFVISTSDGAAVKYVIVDMTLNAGLGGVEVPSLSGGNGTVLLASPKSEGALVIPEYTAGNVPTNEYWVIFHSINTAEYFVFKTNASAIAAHSTPIQTQGFVPAGQPVLIMKTNSCFNQIATAYYTGARVDVLPFNNVTGIISAPTIILNGTGAGNPFFITQIYGVEFSPNGRFLYVTESGNNGNKGIFQFDLNAGGTGTNPVAVVGSRRYFTGNGSVVRFGALQLGPDGKIYVPGYNAVAPGYISVVTTPDVQWAAAAPNATEFQYLKYLYTTKGVGEGLPPVLKNLLTAVRIFYNNACEGGTTNFSYVFGGAAVSTTWNFGDPASGALNTSTSASPSHMYATAGTYTATLTIVDNCTRTWTGTVSVIVKTGPVVSVPGSLCASTNITLTGTGTNAANYTWSLNSNMIPATGPSSTYVYNGTLPRTIYVQDPTPLATYTVGNTTAAATAGADIGHTYFETFTSLTITSFQSIARLNGQNATFTIRSEDLLTTYYTVAAPLSVSGTTYTFNPNITLAPGRYVIFTSNVNYSFRFNTDDDGNRDVSGLIDVLGEKNGTKGGAFINIGLSLPDPCGVKAIVLADNCPAPVTLLSFTGEKIEDLIALQWATTNEINNSHFLVQRSINGTDFITLSQIIGTGSSTYSSYSSIDSEPVYGANYYRLAQVDFDGTITYSKVIVIDFGTSPGTVFPNPFSENATVKFSSDIVLSIELIDITGRTVCTYTKNKEQTSITIGEGISKGTYLLRMMSSDKVYISKLIKE